MGVNWEALHKNIGDIGSALGTRAKEQKEKEQAMEFLFAQAMAKAKADEMIQDVKMQKMGEFYKQFGFGGSPTMPREQATGGELVEPTSSMASQYQLVPTFDPDKPFKAEMSPEAQTRVDLRKEKIKQVGTARKDLDKYSSDAMQALVAVDKIETEAKNLPEYKRGFIRQTFSKMGAGIGAYSKDKDITRYLGVVSQELIPMARKLMEEKGPITEFDVDRVEKGLGELTTPLEDKIFLLNQFRDKVRKALINKMQVSEISEEEFAGKYRDLYGKAFLGQGKVSEPSQNTDLDTQINSLLDQLGVD